MILSLFVIVFLSVNTMFVSVFENHRKNYKKVNRYHELNTAQLKKMTAAGSIDVSYDSYFDNFTILTQFERLFKLLQFKSEFKNHNIEIIVDNATTHTG